jgi:hypothetical protein
MIEGFDPPTKLTVNNTGKNFIIASDTCYNMASTNSITGFTSDFLDDNRDRARELVDSYYNDEFLSSIGDPTDVILSEFPAIAWRELYLGCLPPNKQVYLIYERGEPFGRDRDLIVGLNKQIKDEFKHAKIFTNYLSQFGVDVDLTTHEESEEIIQACRTMVDRDEPHHIAAGFQCSTEIRAAFMVQNLAEYIEQEYPNVANTLMKHVVADEGDHLHVGRQIIERFSSDDETDMMQTITDEKFEKIDAAMAARFEAATN